MAIGRIINAANKLAPLIDVVWVEMDLYKP
jgi:hypothetical protein